MSDQTATPGGAFAVAATGQAGLTVTSRTLDTAGGVVSGPDSWTEPQPGFYVAALTAPVVAGDYYVEVIGGASPAAISVHVSATTAATPPSAAGTPGMCQVWVDPADVDCAGAGSDIAEWVEIASGLLFEATGRVYPGVCSARARPCATVQGCFTLVPPDMMFAWGGHGGYHWQTATGDVCGCSPRQRVKLPGIPVRDVTSVRVGGVEVTSAYYRMEGQYLVAQGGYMFPACQDLTAAPDAPGTFVVEYEYGQAPPPLGRLAAANLACQLRSLVNGGDCQLPANVAEVFRQGVRYKLDPAAVASLADSSGVIGMFLRTAPSHRRAAVYSPDAPYARPY